MENLAQLQQQRVEEAKRETALWNQWWESLTRSERKDWLHSHRLMRDTLRTTLHETHAYERSIEGKEPAHAFMRLTLLQRQSAVHNSASLFTDEDARHQATTWLLLTKLRIQHGTQGVNYHYMHH
ncbi:hypothetical protein [Hymenobacter sp. YC55]|uniref:hypothetical protein n=1 Tax=Hymenobacter sp. YC55 TaxID=3034019 RepID=UPI0023F68014|nr:hypothetical protein [Hymenobacter sp. YC55]MDF7810773.1 hypothetical protein [Hymenobacter sp. YC55]